RRQAAAGPRPSEPRAAIAEPSPASVVCAQDEEETLVVARAFNGLGNGKIGVDMTEPVEPDAGAYGRCLLVLRRAGRCIACVEIAKIGEGVELSRIGVEQAARRQVVTQFKNALDAGIAEQLRRIVRATEIAS